MQIAFGDEIWSRLYGPYGNRSVDKMLETLSQKWDAAVAKELFWVELHHQDDIYPATFASLPWLENLSASGDEAFEEIHLFLSHVLHCAYAEGGTGCGSHGKFRGLSTKVADHQHSCMPEREWLTVEDQPILIELEQWFSDNSATIAERCLSLVGSDLETSACAIAGFATLNGSSRVGWSIEMFADGEANDRICRELGAYDAYDTRAVARLYPHVHKRNPELASFMLNYPGCTFFPDDPRQGKLL